MKYIQILETKKLDSIVRVQTNVKTQKDLGKQIPEQAVQSMMNIEKTRAFDELATEH